MISTYVSGFMSAEMRPTNRLSFVRPRFFSSNSATDCSSRQNARMTRTPVRFSRVSAVTRSSPACALPKSGMLTIMMPNVTAKSIGMVTANTSAHLTLIVKAMIIAPNTMNGLRKSRRNPMFRPVCT